MRAPTAPVDGKFRVLVVEDDNHIARLILSNLARAGLECRYAQDGKAGLDAFQEADPHIVLTDIMMPVMDGRELTAKIREISTVPIIMMTAADSDEAQLAGFRAGADDYVPKPFNPQLMVARVVAHLRRVYRYGGALEEAEQKPAVVAAEAIPAGWSRCEACGYMGPRAKFENLNSQGLPFQSCPRCQDGENITYSID